MNRRLKLTVAIIVFLIVVIALVALLKQGSVVDITQRYSVPTVFSSAIADGNNSLVFSNGRSFVKYNYVTGSSTLLSPDNILDDGLTPIDSLAFTANQQYLLFHIQNIVQGSTLDQRLDQLNVDDDGFSLYGYWWVYNVDTQEFSPLPLSVLIAKVEGNNIDAIADNNGNESINTYNASSLVQTSSFSITGVNNFLPLKSGFLLQTPHNQILLTTNGVIIQNLYSSTVIDGVTSEGGQVIGTITNGNNNQLVKLNSQDSSSGSIANNITGAPAISSNSVLYQTSSSLNSTKELNTYNFTNSKHQEWNLNSAWGNFNQEISPIALVGEDTAIVNKNLDSYYLLGNNIGEIKIPPNTYSKTISFDGESIDINYSSSDSALLVSLGSNDLAGEQAAVYQQLKTDGYNPNLLNIQASER